MTQVAWLVALSLAALIASSCGDGQTTVSSEPTSLPRTADPPFELATMTGAASRGDELVVAQEGTNRAAIRWTDGQWSELSAIEAEGFWFYRSVGPTVIAGGYTCEAQTEIGCEGAAPSFYRLSEDLSTWEELESPPPSADLPEEVELTAEIDLTEWGIFTVGGADRYRVDADGTVSEFPIDGFICALDDAAVSVSDVVQVEVGVDALGQPQIEANMSALTVRSMADPSVPTPDIPVPAGVPMLAEHLCGAGYVSTIEPGGTTEWVLDMSERTVVEIESNTNAAGVGGALQVDGGRATTPDGGTLFKLNGKAQVMKRVGLGPWEDTGVRAAGLWATDSTVLRLDPSTWEIIEVD